MNAVISGRAGLALLIDGEKLMSLDVDDLETLVPRHSSDLRFLLTSATDLITLENTSRAQIAERLDLEHDIACALDMTLIALDSDSPMELRAEAVGALDELLADPRVVEHLEFTIYAKPLPASADVMGAMVCATVKATARAFFHRWSKYQKAIGAARESWNGLTDELFGDDLNDKAFFHDAAVNEGLFCLLSTSNGDPSKLSMFFAEALKNRTIISLRNSHIVLQQWSAAFLAALGTATPASGGSGDDHENPSDPSLQSAGSDEPHRARAGIVQKFHTQQELIIAAMRERDVTRALQLLEGLVEFHRETEKAHRETIEALAVAINAKDEVTHEHVLRVQIYAAGVGRILGCSSNEVEALRAGALLHDIGKIAVPDYIINKPGKLTASEFEKMKLHTIAGAQILSRVEFPYPIVPVVRHHHERWDGQGYPDGLSAEDIPLTARILTLVDCFDCLREDRNYRKGMTQQEAIAYILNGSGTQYDPTVVTTFITHLAEFEGEINACCAESVTTLAIKASEQHSESRTQILPGLAENEAAGTPQGMNASDEMSAMCDLAQSVIGARSQNEVLTAFTEKLRPVVPYSMCAITLVDSETGQSSVAHATGSHWNFLKGRVIGAGEGVTGWVLANRKPFCNTDPKLDLLLSVVELDPDYQTLSVFPILKEVTLYGAVSIYSSARGEYTPHHQKLLREAISLLASGLAAQANTLSWDQKLLQFGDTDRNSSREYRIE